MSTENKEFYDLLNEIVNEQTFSLELCPRLEQESPSVSCKQLTTLQLKKLIETVVDSPLTQASFNSTATKVFKDSLTSASSFQLNVVDRLLFILETRIQSLSPTMTVKEEEVEYTINFKEVINNLQQQVKLNQTLFFPRTATEGKLTVKFGVASLSTEAQLNEEIYKNINPSIDNTDELRKVLGDAFIYEIAKCVDSISIEDRVLELSSVSFKSRLKAIESLPASLIQEAIKYIEKYKKIIDECLTVNGHSIAIDGSLFSL